MEQFATKGDGIFMSWTGEGKHTVEEILALPKGERAELLDGEISVICDLNKLDERGCHGAPDWIIEIVSPSSKAMDYYKKPEAYKSAGVKEYWIVDSAKEIVVVYDLAEEEAPVVYRFTDNIKPHVFPELVLHFGEWQQK